MTMQKRSKGKWPQKGISCDEVLEFVVKSLKKVAHSGWPIYGFPQGNPTKLSLRVYKMIIPFQVNSIAGSSENSLTSLGVNRLEREAVSASIDLLGGNNEDYNGLITNGGTTANRFGIQLGRDYLLDDNKNRKIAVFCSSMSHYSIFQICQTLSLDKNTRKECSSIEKKCRNEKGEIIKHIFQERKNGSGIRLIGVDTKGAILVDQLEKKIRRSIFLGIKNFIVIANTGTTLTGAVDDVIRISLLLGKLEGEFSGLIKFYFHIDAAYGGLILPFMKDSPLRYLISLRDNYAILKKSGKEVDSLSVDPHKRYTPYSCGLSIFKRGLEKRLEMQVPYLNGNNVFGPDGSRSGAPVAAYWANIHYLGYDGYRKKIDKCFRNTEYFYSLLEKISGTRMLSSELCVICVSFGRKINFSDKFKYQYYPCSAFFPNNSQNPNSCMNLIYKFVVMDHWRKKDMNVFIKDLKKEIERR